MAPHPSSSQLEVFVEFLEQNPGIAKGHLRTSSAKAETKRRWASIATTLNALGGANKDGTGWAKYWAEKKCALKKISAASGASMRRTGGGPADNLPPLSPLDLRLIVVMGGQEFATGDSQFRINPFPAELDGVAVVVGGDNIESEVVVESEDITDEILTAAPFVLEARQERARSRSPVNRQEQQLPPPPPQRLEPPSARHRRSAVGEEMHRMAEIEARRVEAEALTAQAFVALGAQMERIAAAQENIASAISTLAAAILDIQRRPSGF